MGNEYRSFVRRKMFGENEYAYEVIPYYDRRKKQIRQHVKYLGKVTKEGIRRVRGVVVERPRVAVDFGDVFLVEEMIRETGVDHVLSEVFPKGAVSRLVVLVCSRVLRGVAVSQIGNWYEGTLLVHRYPERGWFSSQSVSRFLEKLGEDELRVRRFFQRWYLRLGGSKKGLFYDITSLSSSSHLIEMLEYGYNRDNETLPQVNVGMVVVSDSGLPVTYKVFPGSIPDVKTLVNLLTDLRGMGMEDVRLVLDRGFYSLKNVGALVNQRLRFILPLPFSRTVTRRLLSRERKHLESPEHVHSYEGSFLHAIQGTLDLAGHRLHYSLYYDRERETRERNQFFRALIEVEERLGQRMLQRGEKPWEVFEDIAGKCAPYLLYRLDNGRLILRRRVKAISRYLNRLGKEILVASEELPWDMPLSLYRAKERVEKVFRAMKNELSTLPLKIHKESTLKGYLFVAYLSLIIYFHLQNRLKDSGVLKKISLEGVLGELRKLKLVDFPSTRYLCEVTKKQTELFDTLGISVPKI